MYEHKHEPLLPRRAFAARLARSAGLGLGFVLASLALGTVGYRFTAHLSWLDAELNAAMILTGMGPVAPLAGPSAKLFASAYALFSGVAFLTGVGILFAPVVHRFLHRFHLEEREGR